MSFHAPTHLGDAILAITTDGFTLEREPTTEEELKEKLKVVK